MILISLVLTAGAQAAENQQEVEGELADAPRDLTKVAEELNSPAGRFSHVFKIKVEDQGGHPVAGVGVTCRWFTPRVKISLSGSLEPDLVGDERTYTTDKDGIVSTDVISAKRCTMWIAQSEGDRLGLALSEKSEWSYPGGPLMKKAGVVEGTLRVIKMGSDVPPLYANSGGISLEDNKWSDFIIFQPDVVREERAGEFIAWCAFNRANTVKVSDIKGLNDGERILRWDAPWSVTVRAKAGGFFKDLKSGVMRFSTDMKDYKREVVMTGNDPVTRVVYFRPGKMPLWSILKLKSGLNLSEIRMVGNDMDSLPNPRISLSVESLTPIGSLGVFSVPEKGYSRDGTLIKEYTWDGGPFSLERVKYRIEDVDPTVHMEREALIELLPLPAIPETLPRK